MEKYDNLRRSEDNAYAENTCERCGSNWLGSVPERCPTCGVEFLPAKEGEK